MKKGETIIEVITAIAAIVIAGVASVTVIISAYRTTTISREYLIAQNLAREGIEGVTNIRDTNWLKYPADKQTCWLIYEGTCDGGTALQLNTSYILDREWDGATLTGKFKMTPKATLDLTTSRVSNADYRLLTVDDDGRYTHTSAVPEITPTNFHRMITLLPTTTVPLDEKQIMIKVKIQWGEEGSASIGTYEVSSVLTNYAK